MSRLLLPQIILSLACVLLEEVLYAESPLALLGVNISEHVQPPPIAGGFVLLLIFLYAIWKIWDLNHETDPSVSEVYVNCEISTDKSDSAQPQQGYIRSLDTHDARLVTREYFQSKGHVRLCMKHIPGHEANPPIVEGEIVQAQPIDKGSWLVDVHFEQREEEVLRELIAALDQSSTRNEIYR